MHGVDFQPPWSNRVPEVLDAAREELALLEFQVYSYATQHSEICINMFDVLLDRIRKYNDDVEVYSTSLPLELLQRGVQRSLKRRR